MKTDHIKPCRLDDPDMRMAEEAIRIAAKKARETAKQFGHGIIIMRDGQIVEVDPVTEKIIRILK